MARENLTHAARAIHCFAVVTHYAAVIDWLENL